MSTGAAPQRVVVVGGGIVGLSCAWSLLRRGVEVTVVDRTAPGAGASWGNAGYVSPAHATPLPEPAILRYGLRAVLDPRSPVSLPLRGDWSRVRFLAGMARHCTARSWAVAMAAYRPLNDAALAAFDAQQADGVQATTVAADILSGFRDGRHAAGMLTELRGVVTAGQAVDVDLLTGAQLRAMDPHLSPSVGFGVRLRGQRYLTPAAYVAALADRVRARGGAIRGGTAVGAVERRSRSVAAITAGEELQADAVVLAAGAWLGALCRPHGVRTAVHAGRGYSFTLPSVLPLRQPLHFPAERIALTPDGERIRVVGVMEFAAPDAPLSPARLRSVIRSLTPLVDHVEWSGRADDWVGPRPLTADGVPVVGRTATEGVYVAGGHGMWGVTLGPVTGELLAEQIVTGRTPAALVPLSPTR